MTPEEAIKLLKGMQNKKMDYAEMVHAPAFAYGYQYVYPEPEDYAIEEAAKALKEIQQYREIGTVEECWKAAGKQKPMNPEKYTDTIQTIDGRFQRDVFECPVCGSFVCDAEDEIPRYCCGCGQRLEESEEK